MTRYLAIAAICALLALGGCAQLTQGVTTVCRDMAKLPTSVAAVLDAQDAHSALGVLWADAKSACVNGAPTIGVDQLWTTLVIGELKALIPAVLPSLVPYLVGLFL